MLLPTFIEELAAMSAGRQAVAGVDEAGAGCWAGPVFAAAVILREAIEDKLIRDSKKLSPAQREKAALIVREAALAWAVGSASAEEIDTMNIRNAAALAMRRALEGLSTAPDFVLVDGFRLRGWDGPQRSLVRGDAKVLSIAAASILAKTSRDALCLELALRYPEYGFEKHKGYGTAAHQTALRRLGPCPEHRRSYAPVKAVIG